MSVLSNMLDIVGRLPVIRSFNRAGGLAAGLLQGVLIIWIGMALVNLFFLNPTRPELQEQLNESLVAIWFYENNPIMSALQG